MKLNNKKVIVGMSGGVDSTVAAFILKNQGYIVEGLFMKNWEQDDNENCSSLQDLQDAQSVCNQLGIILHTINFSYEYWENVFEIFISEYKSGRTPNPDILCNKEIKFKVFLEFALEELEADFIATGHYAIKTDIYGNSKLLRGIDKNKEQSYFLYTLTSKILKKCLFPLGIFTKKEIRNIAYKEGFITAGKKDSFGICFIGKRNFRKFINKYIFSKPGDIITIDGQKIGRHYGVLYYTLGQRKGLCIGGMKNYNNEPWYVVDKDVNKNIIIVDQGMNNIRLISNKLIANNVCWLDGSILKSPIRCTIQTRYRQTEVPAWIEPISNNRIRAIFDRPIYSVTPGQSVVFYISLFCIGGGIIEKNIF